MIGEPYVCNEDDVLAYLAGELECEDDLEMSVHLAECGECRDWAAEFRALDQVIPACCKDEAIHWHSFSSPFGTMYAAATGRGVARITWRELGEEGFVRELEGSFPCRPVVRDPDALAEVEREVTQYFRGERTEFDMELDLSTLTDFERSVLAELTEAIKFGQVLPYSELARRLGKPKAARAVGNAVGANPVPIVVPCHRVVRLDGGLGGYGGGVEYKERLLEIEGRGDLLRAS